jgi:4-hydroxy-L-threonine phosphate dehydrogenase PdxA
MANSTLAITRSTIGIPLGDIAGIGPEIVVMALAQPAVCQTAKPLVIGEANALRRALRIAGLNLEIHPITDPAQGHYRHGMIDLLDLANVDAESVAPRPGAGRRRSRRL